MTKHRFQLISPVYATLVQLYIDNLRPKADHQLANEHRSDYVANDDVTYSFDYVSDIIDRAKSGEPIIGEEASTSLRGLIYQHLIKQDKSPYEFENLVYFAYKLYSPFEGVEVDQ